MRLSGQKGAMHDRNGTGGMSDKGSPLQRLKGINIYARPKREFQRATGHGAVASIFMVLASAVLTWRELSFSMRTETTERLFVNSTISSVANVTFDVVFPSIACNLISLDAEDALGLPQEDLRHNVTRTRLDRQGRPLDDGERHEVGNTLKEFLATQSGQVTGPDEEESKHTSERTDDCNCYGAGEEGECCRSCQDVKAAYRRRGWKFDAASVPTCGDQRRSESIADEAPNAQSEADEGCRLAGSLEVTKSEGNFHFAPGYRLHRRASSLTLMDRIQVALEAFNTTHTINSLRFGAQPPPDHASPRHVAASTVLEGHEKVVQDTHAMHQYFLQVVPTVYRFVNGSTVHSSQYSATEHLKHVHAGPSRGLPGVYFYYTVSPIQALVEDRRHGFLSFLTGVCAVVGGLYSVLDVVNSRLDGLLSRGGGHRSR